MSKMYGCILCILFVLSLDLNSFNLVKCCHPMRELYELAESGGTGSKPPDTRRRLKLSLGGVANPSASISFNAFESICLLTDF